MPAMTALYTIISADTHAGASHPQYGEYLDESFREEFDACRGKYKNPFKDLVHREWSAAAWWNRMPRQPHRRPVTGVG